MAVSVRTGIPIIPQRPDQTIRQAASVQAVPCLPFQPQYGAGAVPG